MKRLQHKANAFLLSSLFLFMILVISCTKQESRPPKVTANIGFNTSSKTITVADTSKVYALAELDISSVNNAVAYDVYFRFDDPAVINQLVKISHGTFTDAASGTVYYKIPVARGIKKASATFLPINISTGDKTFSLTLYNDLSGNNNYVIDEGRNKVTVNFQDK